MASTSASGRHWPAWNSRSPWERCCAASPTWRWPATGRTYPGGRARCCGGRRRCPSASPRRRPASKEGAGLSILQAPTIGTTLSHLSLSDFLDLAASPAAAADVSAALGEAFVVVDLSGPAAVAPDTRERAGTAARTAGTLPVVVVGAGRDGTAGLPEPVAA